MVLACALAAVLALPAAAQAKPGYYVSEPSRLSVISLGGSNGYRISLIAYNSKRVMLFASKGFESSTSVTYSVRGRVTGETVEARFGSLGRVSLRLEPNPAEEVEKRQPGCKGKRAVTRTGRFTGTIRFRGEQGFTRVRARAANGFSSRSFRTVCKRPDRGEDRPSPKLPPTTSLGAISSRAPAAPWFSVYKQEAQRVGRFFTSEEAEYTANATERRQGMTIFRSASASAPPETFAVSPPGSSPVTATVAPPSPFSGTATYEKSGGSASWSGDLAVELPGRGEAPLADPTYRAELCRSFACACPAGYCSFIVAVGVSSGERRVQRLRQLASRVRP